MNEEKELQKIIQMEIDEVFKDFLEWEKEYYTQDALHISHQK